MSDQLIKANEVGMFYYDATTGRWRRLGGSGGGGGAPSGAAGGDLSGTYPNPVVMQASSSFALPGDIAPPQITADQNDYNPTGLATASILRLNSDTARAITGLAGGADGRVIILVNNGANDITIKDSSPSSIAGNRFILPSASSGATAWPPGYVNGLGMTWASVGNLLVKPGTCVDSTGTVNLTLPSGGGIVVGTALGTNQAMDGVINGNTTGTVSFSTASPVFTGSLTNFLTAFGVRALTGNISNSGTTTITGVGTKFLSQVAINDLIGTAALGYFQVAAIASDTSLTLASLPGTNFTGQTPNCIEQPLLGIGAGTVFRVKQIASDTSLTVDRNVGSTNSAQPWAIGGIYPGDGTNNAYYYLFVVSNGTTTGVVLSSQRTKPYCASSYGANTVYGTYRRIGTVTCDKNSNFLNFAQWGNGEDRWYEYYFNEDTNNSTLGSGLLGGTWTTISAAGIAPPTAVMLLCSTISNAGGYISLRAANYGATNTLETPKYTYLLGGSTVGAPQLTKCDGAQNIQYAAFGGVNSAIKLYGYQEAL